MPIFTDDDDKPIKTTTAEQHALDNPGHTIHVHYDYSDGALLLRCQGFAGYPASACDWWDEQLFDPESEMT